MKFFGFELRRSHSKGTEKQAGGGLRQVHIPFLWQQQYGDELSTEHDYEGLVHAYKNWVYTFANKNAVNVAQVPLRLYVAKQSAGEKLFFRSKIISKRQEKLIESNAGIQRLACVKGAAQIEELTEHPFLSLMQNVNPFMNQFDLLEQTDLYQEVTGDSYWRLMFDEIGRPAQIWIMPSQFMRIVPSKEEFIKEYRFRSGWMVDSMPIAREEIIHFKFPSLTSVYYGMSPLAANVETHNIDVNMNRYDSNLLKHGGRIDGYFKAEGDAPIEDEDFKRAKEELKDAFGGAERSGNNMPLLQKITFVPIGLPPKEMSFLRGRKWTKEMLANAYGQSLGMYDENATRANSEMADYTYKRDTVRPRCIRMEEKINEQVMPLYDDSIFVMFDNPVPEDRDFELRERTEHVKAKITTINEERIKIGLEPMPWGDVPIASITEVPFGEFFGGQSPEQMTAGIKKKEQLQSDEDHIGDDGIDNPLADSADKARAEWWHKFAAQEDLHEGKVRKELKALFEEQKKEVLQNLKKFQRFTGKRGRVKISLNDLLFSKAAWDKLFSERMNKHVDETAEAGIDYGTEQLTAAGAEVEIGRRQVSDFIKRYNVRLSEKIWPDVNETTYEALKATTLESVAADESIDELRKRVDSVMDNAITYRSERIARSETVRAFNTGSIESWKISDVVEGKEWNAELDDRTCEYCLLMDGKTTGLEENYFDEGDSMAGAQERMVFDYSDIPSPPLHPNCRCALLAVLK